MDIKKLSNSDPGTPEYFIETPDGDITLRQEIFCWRYACHGNGMKAYREAYEKSKTSGAHSIGSWKLLQKDKIVNRIKELICQHQENTIDLRKGPWDHYGLDGIGDEGRKTPHVLNNTDIARAILDA